MISPGYASVLLSCAAPQFHPWPISLHSWWTELTATTEREVKKANRDLTQHLNGYKDPLARVNEIQKRFTTLVGEMKRLERDHQKSKKRADQLQKEKDTAKSELSKANSIKEKLEKLSRETSNENRKLRVCLWYNVSRNISLTHSRPMSNNSGMSNQRCAKNCTTV